MGSMPGASRGADPSPSRWARDCASKGRAHFHIVVEIDEKITAQLGPLCERCGGISLRGVFVAVQPHADEILPSSKDLS